MLLTTYDTALMDQDFLSQVPWHYAIIDEAQRLKNPNSVIFNYEFILSVFVVSVNHVILVFQICPFAFLSLDFSMRSLYAPGNHKVNEGMMGGMVTEFKLIVCAYCIF